MPELMKNPGAGPASGYGSTFSVHAEYHVTTMRITKSGTWTGKARSREIDPVRRADLVEPRSRPPRIPAWHPRGRNASTAS